MRASSKVSTTVVLVLSLTGCVNRPLGDGGASSTADQRPVTGQAVEQSESAAMPMHGPENAPVATTDRPREASEQAPQTTVGSIRTDHGLPPGTDYRRDPVTGTVVRLQGTDLSAEIKSFRDLPRLKATGQYDEIALRVIETYRELFGLVTPRRELEVQWVREDQRNHRRVGFSQRYADLPVWGAFIEAHIDDRYRVYLIDGHYIKTPTAPPANPMVTATAAESIASSELGGRGGCVGCSSRLLLYPLTTDLVPAYQVRVPRTGGQEWSVLVDGQNGRVLDKSRQTNKPGRWPDR